jgi:hypothetical protein
MGDEKSLPPLSLQLTIFPDSLLVRTRKSPSELSTQDYRFTSVLSDATIRELKGLLPGFLAEPAFELNIIALYAMKALGASFAYLQNAVEENACKPVPLPIRNALSLSRRHSKSRLFPTYAPVSDDDSAIEDNY